MAQTNSQLKIRPYLHENDSDDVPFLVSKAHMEPLAVANNRSYAHPITIGAWLSLSCALIQYMDWWPGSQSYGGVLAYLTPLPAFAAVAVPILFFYDWLNRPYFERTAQKALRNRDLLNIERTYTISPASGFHILEYEGRTIGILGLDASPAAAQETQTGRARIRHFYVSEPYRQTGIQNDLLVHAINQAFSSPEVSSIEADYSMLTPYVKKGLLDHGFKISTSHRNGLMISWEVGTAVLQKTAWENRSNTKSTPKSPRRR